jgi:AraC-like DNA-binding protein
MGCDHNQNSFAADFDRWARREVATVTPIPGLTLYRHSAPTAPHPGVMEASLSVVISGRKRLGVGDRSYEYGRERFLLTSVDLPVTASVLEASADAPYRSILLSINLAAVRALLAEFTPPAQSAVQMDVVAMAEVTQDLLEPLLRLCRLSDRPAEIPVLAAQVQREILFRLIMSPVGPQLRGLASLDGVMRGVQRAVEWLRANFKRQGSIAELAEIANMGVSTLHRQFKMATSMTPLQYRKYLQLNEAHRLMAVDRLNAASVSYEVGYGSPTQFSREYRRLFGQAPKANVSAIVSASRNPAQNGIGA